MVVKPKYSRRAKLEEKQSIKNAFFFAGLTIVFLALFIFVGLPAIAKLAGFLGEIKKSTTPIEKQDTTPPAPPIISNLPDFTNSTSLEVMGTAEPGATLILVLNNQEKETLVNKEGEFALTIELKKGENKLFAYARDAAGNESQKTQIQKIIFDDQAPDLEIASPQDGQQFYGSKQRQINIRGQTEEGASVTINERIVAVNSQGEFSFTTTLAEGENQFTIKAEDRAGNSTEKTLTLYFTP